MDIIIDCDYEIRSNWTAFSSWYSVYKNLPECNIIIMCCRTKFCNYSFLNWAYKLKTKIFQYSDKKDCVKIAVEHKLASLPLIKISPYIVATREFDSKIINKIDEGKNCGDNLLEMVFDFDSKKESIKLYEEASSQDIACFVSFKEGCGRFVCSDWVDAKGGPFENANKFVNNIVTANEIKILQQWNDLNIIYGIIK